MTVCVSLRRCEIKCINVDISCENIWFLCCLWIDDIGASETKWVNPDDI